MADPRRPARPLWMVVVLLLVASGALWWAGRLHWQPAAPTLGPFALLALAAVAGVLALSGTRRALGVVLVLVAAGATWYVLAGRQTGAGTVVAVGGCAALLAAGALLAATAHQLPKLGARYQTPGAVRESGEQDRELWQALSDGEDPTAGTR